MDAAANDKVVTLAHCGVRFVLLLLSLYVSTTLTGTGYQEKCLAWKENPAPSAPIGSLEDICLTGVWLGKTRWKHWDTDK